MIALFLSEFLRKMAIIQTCQHSHIQSNIRSENVECIFLQPIFISLPFVNLAIGK